MTEAEWRECTDTGTLLMGLPPKSVTDRKIRLFRIACCRQFWHCLTIKEARDAVKNAEAFVEGLVPVEHLRVAYAFGFRRFAAYLNNKRNWKSRVEIGERIYWVGYAIDTGSQNCDGFLPTPESPPSPQLNEVHHSLVREVFGNPFRPVTINPSWLTPTVLALATGIYADKAFDRMPILADALQEAGCDNGELLNHCRESGEHVRGCWVIDIILSK